MTAKAMVPEQRVVLCGHSSAGSGGGVAGEDEKAEALRKLECKC